MAGRQVGWVEQQVELTLGIIASSPDSEASVGLAVRPWESLSFCANLVYRLLGLAALAVD
jgi:hypothetical protein